MNRLVNDPFITDIAYAKYLFQHDTVHGAFKGTCEINKGEDSLIINGSTVVLFTREKDPKNIPWGLHGVETVVECTGVFKCTEKCSG